MNMVQRLQVAEFVDHDFDWIGDGADIVITEQAAIAVYHNPAGDIVIRQKAGAGEDSDSLVVLQPDFAGTLARAIVNAAKSTLPDLEPKDTTAALRQRRYRERHRNGSNGVTPRHAKDELPHG